MTLSAPKVDHSKELPCHKYYGVYVISILDAYSIDSYYTVPGKTGV